MIQFLTLMAALLWPQPPADFAPGSLSRNQLPTARALDYEFNEVQISSILGWLRRVGVRPPVALGGQVSGWLWAQAPSGGWWRLANYRVEGELSSPLLDVDRFSIREARVRFGYRDSLWSIGSANGQIESRGENGQRTPLGQAQLAVTLPMSADESVQASGSLKQVSLVSLLNSLGITEYVPTGNAQATFRMTTPLRTLSDPFNWRATGNITGTEIDFGEVQGVSLTSQWQLNERILRLSETDVTLREARWRVGGQLALFDNYTWSVALPAQRVTLTSTLYQNLNLDAVEPAYLPLGSINLAANAQGTLTPWAAEYGVSISDGQVAWLGNRIGNFNTQVRLVSDGLMLDALSANLAGGTVAAQAAFTTQIDDPVTLHINYQQLDLAQLQIPAHLLNEGEEPLAMRGVVSGQARLSAPKQDLSDPRALAAEINGTGTQVWIGDWGLGNIQYTLSKATGTNDLSVQVKDAGLASRWQANGQLTLQDNDSWSYDIDARGHRLDLSVPELLELMGIENQLPVALEVLLVTGNIKLLGNSQDGLQSTVFHLSNVTTLERNQVVWSQGNMQGYTTPKVLVIERSNFTIGGSEISGAITWHLPATPPESAGEVDDSNNVNKVPVGELELPEQDRLALSIRGLTLQTLAAWNLWPVGSVPTSLSGLINARIDVERPQGASAHLLAHWQGELELEISQLNAAGQALGEVTLFGRLTDQQWQADVSGELLQASIDGTLTAQIEHQPQWRIEQMQGNLTWLGAEIGRVTGVWQAAHKALDWSGLANVRMQLDWQAEGTHSGTAEIEIPRLAYRQRAVLRELRGQLMLDGQRLRVARLSGGLGDGRMDISGNYDLVAQSFEGLTVNLNRVDLAEAARLIDPDLASQIQGRADMRGKVWLNNGLDVRGAVRVNDVIWNGIPISEAHSDVNVSSTPDMAMMRIDARNIRGRAFGGRLDADLQSRVSRSSALQLRVRIDRGEVEQLSQWSGTASVIGRGKFNGNLVLGAPRLGSLSDLQGTLDIDFEDTNARTLPVADQLARFVPLFGLGSTEFERGRLVGTISRGDLRMRSLALWGPQLSVLGSGNVGLVSSRLDMQLVVRVGGGLSQQIAANYLTQLAAASVPPVQLVLQINRLVANRAIFLRVAGTTAQPIIQPQAARMVEQLLLRSLLEQAVGLPSAVSALPVSSQILNPAAE